MNGREISLSGLDKFTQRVLTVLVDELYTKITTDGVSAVFPDDPSEQHKLIGVMTKYYEDREQYERCAVLHKLNVIN